MDNRRDKRFMERNTVFIKPTTEGREAVVASAINAHTRDLSLSGARICTPHRRRGQVDQEVRGGRRPLRKRRRVPAQHLADAALAHQAPLRREERHPHGRLSVVGTWPVLKGFPPSRVIPVDPDLSYNRGPMVS